MSRAMYRSNFLSSNQKDRIAYYVFQADPLTQPPKAVIQISHGMCEYFLRYSDFASFLVDHGYAVCGNDHLGHGDSVPSDKYLGYFAPEKGWNYLVEDVHRLTVLMKGRFPNVPIILLGHSMGSFIARLYLDRYSQELAGCMIVGTNGGNPFTAVGISLAKQIKAVKGEFYRSDLLQKMMNAGFNSKYAEHYSIYDWLSRDKQVVDQFAADEKCGFTFTTSGFLDLFTMIQMISRSSWGENIRKDLPLYLFAGAADPVGGHGKGVEKVSRHLKQLGIRDVECKLYPEARHEVLNELNKQEVYQDCLDWLNRHGFGEN
ncbi:lysophospholipase L2 [uncultured Ruminococcus sp.]|uniref:Lysophospholipase n=1 Tax=Massiliimalia timonensis TaxID=1987501 RepID=A0A8J6NZ77_9FIRM|nr:alpha/beta fold hydrolase [Massiliimalia timonensis]MBC8610011.1 lysophospholipase [Massiliimalia timonensis]SCH14702.1 lysophospholipase L2 [uncultured Ruminococcus sp.]SCH81539.1 lysophospholipase L2 [uncultured Clostridium sp.]